MTPLLNGHFAPITFSVGFIEKPLDDVVNTYFPWTKKIYPSAEMIQIQGGLPRLLSQLEPLAIPRTRRLLVSTRSRWTAYFDNGKGGTDAFPPMTYLCQQLRCRGLLVGWVPHTLHTDTDDAKGTYGAVQFQLLADSPTDFLNTERSISAAYDCKWTFSTHGKIQPFEKLEYYTAKRLARRFTPEMLNEYCQALGLSPFDETFYTSTGVLVTIREPPGAFREGIPLAEVRKDLNLPVDWRTDAERANRET